jgi:hypothetical protein
MLLSSRYLSSEKERERKTYLFVFIFFFLFSFLRLGPVLPPTPARGIGGIGVVAFGANRRISSLAYLVDGFGLFGGWVGVLIPSLLS